MLCCYELKHVSFIDIYYLKNISIIIGLRSDSLTTSGDIYLSGDETLVL